MGGVLSPLLANIALSALDEHFDEEYRRTMATTYQRRARRRKGMGNWRLVRYADDFVLMVSGTRADAEALRGEVAEVLAPLGLRLAEAKTRVGHIDDGVEFLGFRIQRRRKRGAQKRYVYVLVSGKALLSIRRKVKAWTRRSWLKETPGWLVLRINQVLRGWANYFKCATAKRAFSTLGWYARTRVSRWLRDRYAGRKRMTWKEFKRRFLVPREGLVADGVVLFNPGTVPILRYRYRGYDIPTPWKAA